MKSFFDFIGRTEAVEGLGAGARQFWQTMAYLVAIVYFCQKVFFQMKDFLI
ncbi:hypothetical protein ACT8ZR_13240 [Neobacillus sp. M.A.Huq-85]|nr:hypothetical protein QNK12_30395 [Neobacillus cucumis]